MSQDTTSLAPLDALLMRVLDGVASPEEQGELTVDEAELAALRGVGDLVREAVLEESAAGPCEVADAVMTALGLADELSQAFEGLRSLASEPLDVADGVMAAVLEEESAVAEEVAPPEAVYSALNDGELSVEERLRIARNLVDDRVALNSLSAYAELGRLLRTTLEEETRHADLDGIWGGVAQAIGLEDPEEVPGWEPVSAALRAAVSERSELTVGQQRELTDNVMAALPAPVVAPAELDLDAADPEPAGSWMQALAVPALAMAAALIVVVGLLVPASGELPGATTPDGDVEVFELARANEAEIEELELSDGLMIHVLQGEEEGAPMILVIEEEPATQAEDPWDEIEWEEL